MVRLPHEEKEEDNNGDGRVKMLLCIFSNLRKAVAPISVGIDAIG